MYRYCLGILFVLGFCAKANAGWSFRNNVELSPQYRSLSQKGFSEFDEVWDVFALINTHAEYSSENWNFEAKPEIRSVMSRGVLDPLPAGVSSQTSRRVLNSRRMLFREKDGEAYFDFDRLNLRHGFENGDIYIGRKPLSLGVLRFFPVWNKLTLPLIFQPGPEWIENPDIIGGSYQSGRFSYRLVASRTGDAQKDDLVLLETRFSGEGSDLQMLAGWWWENVAVGVAGAFDVLASTLRVEALWLEQTAGANRRPQVQAGLGFERALSEKWTLVTEALYQSEGVLDVKNTLSAPNRFMILSGRWYLLPNLSYQVHPLWTLRAGVLAALTKSDSYVAIAGFEHSVTDNTTLTLKLKLPFGSRVGEFGSARYSDIFGYRLGASSTALLQLQSTF